MNDDSHKNSKVTGQLSKLRGAVEGLKPKIEAVEERARSTVREQLDGLQDKRARAGKMLQEFSATSHDAWENIKSGLDQSWRHLSQTAAETAQKVRAAVGSHASEEEIRQIAYQLWLDEKCPHGRHLEHWSRAEAIWRERQIPGGQEKTAAGAEATAAAPPARKKRATASKTRRGTSAGAKRRKARPSPEAPEQ